MNCVPVRQLYKRVTVQHLWAVVILAGVFIFVNTHPIRPHDFWWHIAAGREIRTTGQIPHLDTYSYTAPGAPYASYQMFWLMEVVLYTIYRIGGLALIVFHQSLVVTSAYLLIFLTALRGTNHWRLSAFGLLFAATLGLNDWNVRPQVIAFLLGAVFIYLIQRLRAGGRREWAVLFPLGMLVWVNSHGSFPIGLLVIGLWLGDEIWKLISAPWIRHAPINAKNILLPGIILLISAMTCLINPRGFGVFQYLHNMGENAVVQELVVEWSPPRFSTLSGGLFLGALLLTLVILAVSPRRPTFYQLGAFICLAGLGLGTSRGIVWYGLIMGPIVAEHSYAILGSIRSHIRPGIENAGSPAITWAIIVIISALSIISLPWFKDWLPMPADKAGLISMETPVAATEFLQINQPPGNLFHAMSFGSYLIWAAQPEYRVFVDSRIELYPETVWRDYLEISAALGDWEERLQEYDVRTLMLSRMEQPGLVMAAEGSNNWELVYEDTAALIFIAR
jgi:hypothetical protein